MSMMHKLFLVVALLVFNAQASADIEPTSGRYIEERTDLQIKVPGNNIKWMRLYEEGQWKFNQAWASLVFEVDSADGSVIRIIRGGDSYEKLDSAGTIYKFGPRLKLRKNGNGSWSWTDRDGNSMQYNSDGRTLSMGHISGYSASFVYENNRLTGVNDANNTRVLSLSHDVAGNVERATDHTGRFVQYDWSAVDLGAQPVRYKLDKVTDARGFDWLYDYSNQPNQDGYVDLTKITDAELRVTKIDYGSSGRVKKITNALSQSTHYTFDYIKARKEYYLKTTYPGGRVVESWYERDGELKREDINGITIISITEDLRKDFIKDAFGRITTLEFDEFRNLLQTTYPDGSSTSATYDVSNSNVLSRTDERGTLTSYTYFSSGRLQRMIEAVGTDVERSTIYTYDTFGQQETLTQLGDAVTEEAVTSYEYDAFGNVTKMINAEGHETEYQSHDAIGNAWTKIDGRDKVWSYTYDAHGNLTSSATPLQHTTVQEYDQVGNLIKITHPDTESIEYKYDELNRLIKETNELNHEMKYEYDLAGNRTKVIDQDLREVNFVYDLFNRMVSDTDAAGNVVTFHYPSISDQDSFNINYAVKVTSPTLTLFLDHDLRGRVISERVEYLSGAIQKSESLLYEYDLAGNLIKRTDPESRSTQYEFDALNRTRKNIEPLNVITVLESDSRDNLIGLTDALNQKHIFAFDRINQLESHRQPLLQNDHFSYDANGNIETIINGNGQTTSYQYDDSSRNTIIEFRDSGNILIKTVSYGYDSRNNMSSYDDSTSSGVYEYDATNQKTKETITIDNQSFIGEYDYHADGLLKAYTDNGQPSYGYYYNNIRLLNNVVIPNEGNISFQNFIWNEAQTVIYPGGTTRTNTYDGLQRLIGAQVLSQSAVSIMDFQFNYSPVGNLSDKATDHGNYVYGYDELNRLTSADYPTLTDEAFSYDSLGNRITSLETGESEWDYNRNNQLIDAINQSYEYDLNGNLLTEKNAQGQVTKRYVYNVQNHLTEIWDGSNQLIASYYTNPMGQRLQKNVVNTDQSVTTTFFHYSDHGLVSEYTEGVATRYVLNPQNPWFTDPIAKIQNNELYFYQTDHLGSVQKLHDKSGVVVNSKEVNAFGEWQSQVNLIEDNLGFPGQYLDRESGQFYNFKRYYQPNTGRYTQHDPYLFHDHANLYQYALLNPKSYFDPTGELVFLPRVGYYLWRLGLWLNARKNLLCFPACMLKACLQNGESSAIAAAKCAIECGSKLIKKKKPKNPKKPPSHKDNKNTHDSYGKKQRKQKRKRKGGGGFG